MFVFSFLTFVIVKVKYFVKVNSLWVGTYGNRIDELGKMIWSQFSTKVLTITMLDINPLTTNVPHHIETSLLIWNANPLTSFYMMGNIRR